MEKIKSRDNSTMNLRFSHNHDFHCRIMHSRDIGHFYAAVADAVEEDRRVHRVDNAYTEAISADPTAEPLHALQHTADSLPDGLVPVTRGLILDWGEHAGLLWDKKRAEVRLSEAYYVDHTSCRENYGAVSALVLAYAAS